VLLWGESQRDIEMCKEVLEQARARAADGPKAAHRSARRAGCRLGQGAAGSRSAAARFCRRGARRPRALRHRLPERSAAASSQLCRRGSVARTALRLRPG